MYLKSIEVQGFKSFANKIVFEFHDGITAIVGPNGSGKSNVADAVRWVLGEQSAKQLRGSKMEDVIFSGTELRRPLGFAYVAITLDNKDHKLPIAYEEVTVARRVYRSGESEYLMNGSSCRLRDVQELFLDTGIGKEGYSIIGQGQIDKILSGKPEERRELFDEAAGIVKFKKRKAAAEKNLAEEKVNLSRISDILGELEKQIGPLETQSAIAKEYLKYKEQLKQLEIQLFLLEQEKQFEEKAKVEENKQIVCDDLEQTKAEYDSTKSEYERLEAELEQYVRQIEKKRSQYSELQVFLQKQEGEIRLLFEQISSIRQSEMHYNNRLSVIQTSLAEYQTEYAGLLEQKQENEEKLDDLDEAQAESLQELAQVRRQLAELSAEMEQCNRRIMELLEENGTLKTNMERFQILREQNRIKKAELNSRLLKNQSEKAELETRVQRSKRVLQTISEKIESVLAENREAEKNLVHIQQQLTESTAKIEQAQREYMNVASRAESIKNLAERYDGYGTSIRRVMEQKEKESGIVGVVADILQVDKKYETAIETALGGSIQNIVTEDEDTAKRLIAYLKQNKFGRATFLPLTSITAKETREQGILQETGVIGYADTLVRAEQRFEKLVLFLLGRIVVVDTIDHALQLAKKYRYTLRIVTLEGEQLNPGGSLSGGAYKNNSNLLGRKREAEQLTEQADRLKQVWDDVVAEREMLREKRQLLRENMEERKKALQHDYLEQNTAKLQLNQEQEKEHAYIASYESIVTECKELEHQEEELKQNIKELSMVFIRNEKEEALCKKQLEEYGKTLETVKAKEQSSSASGEKIRMEFSAQEQAKLFLQENMRRVQGEIDKLQKEKQELQLQTGTVSDQTKEKEEAIQNIEESIRQYKTESQTLEADIQRLTQEREQMTQSHRGFFIKREGLAERRSVLDKELFRLQTQLEKIGEQMEEQSNYMWEEYELTFAQAEQFRNENQTSMPQVKKDIGELKGKIRDLGDVNVNAIEDFKNLSERYEFLNTQRNDLIQAEETLVAMIAQLDEEMRKQFEEKFAAIRTQFDTVFKELFGGGKGTLELQEDEDILEAGIRIIAQPPGKKLQNMMQLSGGEKALTAIALLFAIQNLKPSPFCLLDEIEAALDDSNVKRYAKYLHKLTKDTQFIVITHRRGTMAAADILYGITMQEKGVSTLVSVNLIEDKLEG